LKERSRRFTGTQRFLLVSSFVITLGSWAVLPYMSVLLHERLGLGLGVVGAVLAVTSLVQFSGCIVGAAIAERFGLQRTLFVALVLHAAGFAGFIGSLWWPVLTIVGLGSICCGAALYLPSVKAYLVHGVEERNRPLLLSSSNSALNAGLALGPLAAGPFVLDSSATVFTTVTILFVGLTIGHAILPRESGREAPAEPAWRVLAGIRVLPFACTALTFYLHMFFYYYLPVFTVPRVSSAFYGVVLMLHSLILVVLQPVLAGWVGRLDYPKAMLFGFGAMAAGMAILTIGDAVAIVAGAVVICLGEVVLFLKNDLEALARSQRSSAVVFGQQRLAAGIGAFVSGIIGGAGYDAFDNAGYAPLFWLAVAAQCVILPVALLLGWRRFRRTGTEPGEVVGTSP
jgi:predicted MFS family arabinose efflux permease